jgi:hypothetical protein
VHCRQGTRRRPLDYKQDYKGQITFFAWETYEDLCRHLGVSDKNPGAFRRNVVTRGVDLNEWIGKEFEIKGCSSREPKKLALAYG